MPTLRSSMSLNDFLFLKSALCFPSSGFYSINQFEKKNVAHVVSGWVAGAEAESALAPAPTSEPVRDLHPTPQPVRDLHPTPPLFQVYPSPPATSIPIRLISLPDTSGYQVVQLSPPPPLIGLPLPNITATPSYILGELYVRKKKRSGSYREISY